MTTNPFEQRKLICDDCREANPSLMSCIHTFGPRTRKSTILSEGTSIPGIIPDAESDDKRSHAPLVERTRISLPSNKRLDLHVAYPEDNDFLNPEIIAPGV